MAGKLLLPFTTGLLLGITGGPSGEDRTAGLLAIAELTLASMVMHGGT